jgi:hypothetical protein
MAELVGALQLAVNQCPVHDHRHRLGFVDVITTNFKYVLVQEHQVSLFATSIDPSSSDRPKLSPLFASTAPVGRIRG